MSHLTVYRLHIASVIAWFVFDVLIISFSISSARSSERRFQRRRSLILFCRVGGQWSTQNAMTTLLSHALLCSLTPNRQTSSIAMPRFVLATIPETLNPTNALQAFTAAGSGAAERTPCAQNKKQNAWQDGAFCTQYFKFSMLRHSEAEDMLI